MGSGKSEIGVIDFLKYTDIPNFIGIITRRTTPQLKGAGGILTKCKRLFGKVYKIGEDFQWREKDNKFVFKSGAEIFLKHFEHEKDKDNWQGTELNLCLIDEGCQFTQDQIQYVMSRMRNPSCPSIRPHLKITCNPDSTHMFAKWVEPYLLEDGTPDRTKDGLIRYFTFSDGDFSWGDTKEELVERVGCHIDDILSFTFISANVYDNPIIQKINPKYVAWLKGLKSIERQRLLLGNWRVKEEGQSYIQRKWFLPMVSPPPHTEFVKICRAYDFAGSLPTEANGGRCDYTACVKMGKLKNGEYVILNVTRTRIRFGDWVQFVLDNSRLDGSNVDIILPIDPNPAAKAATQMMVNELTAHGLYVTTKRASSSKVDRFRPFSSAVQNGLVHLVDNCTDDLWNKSFNDNEPYLNELESFEGKREINDMADCSADAFSYLAQSIFIPDFSHGLLTTNLSSNSLFHGR